MFHSSWTMKAANRWPRVASSFTVITIVFIKNPRSLNLLPGASNFSAPLLLSSLFRLSPTAPRVDLVKFTLGVQYLMGLLLYKFFFSVENNYTRFLLFYLFHFICLFFVQSELHGLAALQWSICLDSLSGYFFFLDLTSPLFFYIEFETSRLSFDECKTFVLAPVYDKGNLGFQLINSFLSTQGLW